MTTSSISSTRRDGWPRLIGVELINTIHYILNTMLYDRDHWFTDESVRNSLPHYSIGAEGRLALNYWL
jgi:hypothetical protein